MVFDSGVGMRKKCDGLVRKWYGKDVGEMLVIILMRFEVGLFGCLWNRDCLV